MGRKQQTPQELPLFDRPIPRQDAPPFLDLLQRPLVPDDLPRDFDPKTEADHLLNLWSTVEGLQKFAFCDFVHAGGSGMVFRVNSRTFERDLALKVARLKLFAVAPDNAQAARNLSPVSQRELLALEKLSHPNVVRLYDALETDIGVVAICTTYDEKPHPLDTYLETVLNSAPPARLDEPANPFAASRLDRACRFLIARCQEIASALRHMHEEHVFHLDIKPANVLISGSRKAMLTDLGSCVHAADLRSGRAFRVHFTWTYAHPELKSIINDPQSMSGGGLKASASVDSPTKLATYDLFALGKTIQEALAKLENEFRERCYSSYGFKFLHLIACLLLDGRNVPPPTPDARVASQDGRSFVSDTALNYPVEIFQQHRIQSAKDLCDRLHRFTRAYSWNESVPELDAWQSDVINTGAARTAPFTRRVAAILNHPCVRRLKNELQLGMLSDVYPGATHNRWSHTVGVFGATVAYYDALLADPEVPTLRVLIEPNDLEHAMVAALLHDLGQAALAHDFEAACPGFYKHEEAIQRLLQEREWGEPTLTTVVKQFWPNVEIGRVISILRGTTPLSTVRSRDSVDIRKPVDGVAADVLNGPIDADKFDYLVRDSLACGLPYGNGIDRQRFLRALSVDVRGSVEGSRLALAFKAKGSPAIESLLLARYQMYGAVYWHHTFRSMQAMFTYAVASTFKGIDSASKVKLRGKNILCRNIRDLFYDRVICGKGWDASLGRLPDNAVLPADFPNAAPLLVASDSALDFIWQFADDACRHLLLRLAGRDLFKRVFEAKIGDLGEYGDFSAIREELAPSARVSLAQSLEKLFLDSIRDEMRRRRGVRETLSETEATSRVNSLGAGSAPHVVVDFTGRGVPEERNFPREIADPARKYLAGFSTFMEGRRNVFHSLAKLQKDIAAVRVFAARELHELIVRYLTTDRVQSIVQSVVRSIRERQ